MTASKSRMTEVDFDELIVEPVQRVGRGRLQNLPSSGTTEIPRFALAWIARKYPANVSIGWF